jgi:hypothetical protein
MHVRLLGQRLQVDVHGLAEALWRKYWRRCVGLPQELDEVLEGSAQHRRLKNGGIGHNKTSLASLVHHLSTLCAARQRRYNAIAGQVAVGTASLSI